MTTPTIKPELTPVQLKFRELRAAQGWSLKAAGEKLGLPPATLSTYERGDRLPSILTADKVFRGYGWKLDVVPVDDPTRPTTSDAMLRLIVNQLKRYGFEEIVESSSD